LFPQRAEEVGIFHVPEVEGGERASLLGDVLHELREGKFGIVLTASYELDFNFGKKCRERVTFQYLRRIPAQALFATPDRVPRGPR
jgi:hypothetical protein